MMELELTKRGATTRSFRFVLRPINNSRSSRAERGEVQVFREISSDVARPSANGTSRLRLLLHERIFAPLGPDCRCWPVPWKHRNVVAERIKFLPDPAKQQVAVASGQIPATDSAREQNIASDQQFILSSNRNRGCPDNVPALPELPSRAPGIRAPGWRQSGNPARPARFPAGTRSCGKIPDRRSSGRFRRGNRAGSQNGVLIFATSGT